MYVCAHTHMYTHTSTSVLTGQRQMTPVREHRPACVLHHPSHAFIGPLGTMALGRARCASWVLLCGQYSCSLGVPGFS